MDKHKDREVVIAAIEHLLTQVPEEERRALYRVIANIDRLEQLLDTGIIAAITPEEAEECIAYARSKKDYVLMFIVLYDRFRKEAGSRLSQELPHEKP